MNQHIFYRSPEGMCGDFIPFFWEGVYHLFHISGTGWKHVTTRDFVHYDEHGFAIEGGGEGARDRFIYTGCVTEHEGLFHMFYCGHNDDMNPTEVVMHATSTDLFRWDRDPDFCLEPPAWMAKNAYRDPFVVYDAESGEYLMLITGATTENRYKRWGITALATSKDYIHWVPREKPLYQPYAYDSQECPDMFKMGDYWYLVFSEYTRHWETKYRIATSPRGPWHIPANDTLDGRAFYAAKTVFDGNRRIIVGWACRKKDENDKNPYEWGGVLMAHVLGQKENGELTATFLPEMAAAHKAPVSLTPGASFGGGTWRQEASGTYNCRAEGTFSTVQLGDAGPDTLYRATVKMAPGTAAAGIVFRAEYPVFEHYCMLKLEPSRRRIYFDAGYKFWDDVYADEVRPITPTEDGVYHITILTEDSIFAVYVNDEVALSGRCYGKRQGHFGLFVEDGEAVFTHVTVLERNR